MKKIQRPRVVFTPPPRRRVHLQEDDLRPTTTITMNRVVTFFTKAQNGQAEDAALAGDRLPSQPGKSDRFRPLVVLVAEDGLGRLYS